MTMTIGTRKVTTPTLHVTLREEMKARNMGVAQLANALSVQYGVASRWVTEDDAKRVVPQPGTLVQIARLFKLDTVQVFRQAGILPPACDVTPPPNDADVQLLVRRFERILRQVPLEKWAVAFTVTQSIIDHLQALLSRVFDLPPQ